MDEHRDEFITEEQHDIHLDVQQTADEHVALNEEELEENVSF